MRKLIAVVLSLCFTVGSAFAQAPTVRLCDGTIDGCPLMGAQQLGGAPTASASSAVSPNVAGSAASNLVAKSSAGNLYSAYAVCTAACWLMIFNSTTVPGDGSTTAGTGSGNLQDCFPIPAGGVGSINAGSGPPEAFSAGISLAISSTGCGTKTAASTGYIHASVK